MTKFSFPHRAAVHALVALAATATLGASSLSAQQSTTRGFNLGFHLLGAGINVENGGTSSGGGAGFTLGYGLNRSFTLFGTVDGSQIEVDEATVQGQWTLGHVDLGARYYFANTLRRWVPYLQAAITSRLVRVENADVDGENVAQLDFSGGAFTFGGGLAVYLSESTSLDVDLRFSGGEFTSINVGTVSVGGLDLDATSNRFAVGLTWWP